MLMRKGWSKLRGMFFFAKHDSQKVQYRVTATIILMAVKPWLIVRVLLHVLQIYENVPNFYGKSLS